MSFEKEYFPIITIPYHASLRCAKVCANRISVCETMETSGCLYMRQYLDVKLWN